MTEKRIEELREQKEKEMQVQMQIEALLRKNLTDEARTRLNTVRLAKKEVYAQALQSILLLLQRGEPEEKITDEQLKTLLEKMNQAKRDITIRRK